MIFAIDSQTRRLIARVPQGDGVEEFDCVADTCRNPVCRCSTMTVTLRALAPGVLSKLAPERKVSVDLGTRTIDGAFREAASQSDIAFAEVLLAAMEPSDFELLGRLHFMIKSQETELAKPSEIKANFDFDEIERSSIMPTYNDILPYAETMQVVACGIEYAVLDQYCVRSGCTCTDAHLYILPVKEEDDALDTIGLANVNYEEKTWEPDGNESLPCDVAAFKRLIESSFPDVYSKLKARHKKLRAIYANSRKRARAATSIADSIYQKPAGRNDPCPCGSGKKFKKCCMGKGAGGAEARAETAIIIRR